MAVRIRGLHPELTEAGVVGMCGLASLQLFRVSDWRARQVIHEVSRESDMHTEVNDD